MRRVNSRVGAAGAGVAAGATVESAGAAGSMARWSVVA